MTTAWANSLIGLWDRSWNDNRDKSNRETWTRWRYYTARAVLKVYRTLLTTVPHLKQILHNEFAKVYKKIGILIWMNIYRVSHRYGNTFIYFIFIKNGRRNLNQRFRMENSVLKNFGSVDVKIIPNFCTLGVSPNFKITVVCDIKLYWY